MRTRMLRNSITGGGVILLMAAMLLANMAYQKWSIRRDAQGAYNSAYGWCLSKNISILDWSEFGKTGGSFESGPEYPESILEREGSLVRLVAFAAPVDRGRYAQATFLPALLPNLIASAPNAPPMHKALHRMLLTPMPLQSYWWENPPVQTSVFAILKDGAVEDVPVETPVIISGRLVLNKEPNRFFYVLEDAEIAPFS